MNFVNRKRRTTTAETNAFTAIFSYPAGSADLYQRKEGTYFVQGKCYFEIFGPM